MEATTVTIYFMPPGDAGMVGAHSRGAPGRLEIELGDIVRQLSEALPGVSVELVDTSRPLRFPRHRGALRLLRSFGCDALPIVALGDQVVSIGPPAVNELIGLIAARLAPAT